MSRLYHATVDENRWKIERIDNGENYDSYKLVDKKNYEIYFFEYIIGLEQIAEDEVLVYRRATHEDFEITRYKLQKSKLIRTFSKNFSNFSFISDDRIIFRYWDNAGQYRCGGVYSIKDNSMLWGNLKALPPALPSSVMSS